MTPQTLSAQARPAGAPRTSPAGEGVGRHHRRLPNAPGLLAGVGLGGFIDGIVFHQILQWHHFVSSTAEGGGNTVGALEHNTLWDGLFHLAAWSVTAAALYFG